MAAMDYIAKKNKKWGLIKMSQESLTWIFFSAVFFFISSRVKSFFFREEEKNDPEHFYSLSKYTLTQAAASILLV